MQRVIDVYWARLEVMLARACERVLAADIPFYRSLPRAAAEGAMRRVFEAVGHDLRSGTPQQFPALLAALGVQRSSLGVGVSQILAGMNFGFEAVTEEFEVAFAADLEARLHLERFRARIAYAGAASLADAYLDAREKVVRAQADEILHLSTQVLPLYRGILVMPLLGRIDEARAGAILEVLLAAIARHASRVVLLDLSGVPTLDAEAAAHLLRATQAVTLLGATAVLVGVSPQIARTAVDAGLALDRVVTLSDLESGLQHALGLVGRAITALPGRPL